MKFARLFTVLLIWSTGCGLFQQTSRTSNEAHTLAQQDTDWKILNQQKQNTNTSMLQFHRDTGNTTYSIQLWPKGSFTFSADKGFAGEAEKIVVTGKANKAVTTTSAVAVKHEENGEQVVTYKERDKKETGQNQEIKETAVSWKWIIAGLLLIAAAGIWLVRRRNINLLANLYYI